MYTLHDLRAFGRKQGWCPYFLARHMMSFANVVVYNYQYMIDPKVSQVLLTPHTHSLMAGSSPLDKAPSTAVCFRAHQPFGHTQHSEEWQALTVWVWAR